LERKRRQAQEPFGRVRGGKHKKRFNAQTQCSSNPSSRIIDQSLKSIKLLLAQLSSRKGYSNL
jgi:hypothetical protein